MIDRTKRPGSNRRTALGRRLPLAIPTDERLLHAVARSEAARPLSANSGHLTVLGSAFARVDKSCRLTSGRSRLRRTLYYYSGGHIAIKCPCILAIRRSCRGSGRSRHWGPDPVARQPPTHRGAAQNTCGNRHPSPHQDRSCGMRSVSRHSRAAAAGLCADTRRAASTISETLRIVNDTAT